MINVLYAPLFTAVDNDSEARQMGLLELFENAHRYIDLKAGSCTGKLALYRLCIAFLSDAFRLETMYDRADLLETGRFDIEAIIRYVNECEARGSCFVLDDENRPFMQSAYDAALDDNNIKPVSKIMFDCPSGNNHIHCDHRHEDEHEADSAAAFEDMLETYAFCPAGLSGASNVNNTPPVYALIHGDTLFSTFVLNMVSVEELGNIPFGAGEAAWLRNDPVKPGEKAVDMSYQKALTWLPRRLTLKWDANGMVRCLYLQNGLNFQGNALWLDPNVIYRKTKDGLWASLKPELGRQLWRDAGTLLTGDPATRGPIPVQNIGQVWDACPQWLDIELIGLITNQEAVLGRSDERLRIPRELLDSEAAAATFRLALEKTEIMYRALIRDVTSQFCHASDKKKRSVVADQAGEIFLHGMHEVVFGSYLDELLAGLPDLDRNTHFMDAMKEVLEESLTSAVQTTGNDVPSMKRQNRVRSDVRRDYMAIRKEYGLE